MALHPMNRLNKSRYERQLNMQLLMVLMMNNWYNLLRLLTHHMHRMRHSLMNMNRRCMELETMNRLNRLMTVIPKHMRHLMVLMTSMRYTLLRLQQMNNRRMRHTLMNTMSMRKEQLTMIHQNRLRYGQRLSRLHLKERMMSMRYMSHRVRLLHSHLMRHRMDG